MEEAESSAMKNIFLWAIAIMLCIGGIIACAQSTSSSQTKSKTTDATFEEGARAAAAADAAAMASGSKNGNKEKLPVTTETMPEKTVGPPIASSLLQDRILRFVDSLRSPSNVTRHHLEEVMQVKLTQDASFQKWWWYTGATDEKWDYTVKVNEKREDDELPLVDISFSAGDVEADQRATVCTYELEAFARSLVDLGFTRHPGWKQPGAQLLFTRETAGTRFGSTIRVRKYVQQIGTEAADFQYCVYVIHISAGKSLDGE
jgi:hypothetical protein